MKISRGVMLGEVPRLCVCLLMLVAAGSASAAGGGACERGVSWWDRQRGACLPCTRCEPALAVRFPCELHRDTICQSLHEVQIYPFNTLNDSSELDDEYYDDYSDYDETDEVEVAQWDVQTTTLALAASGCVVFFVVVLYFSFNHAKQWRVLKQALRSDVQDLSAKLKLMEAGESPAEPVVLAPTDHIYCNIHLTKGALIAAKKKGLGNVYTLNKHPV